MERYSRYIYTCVQMRPPHNYPCLFSRLYLGSSCSPHHYAQANCILEVGFSVAPPAEYPLFCSSSYFSTAGLESWPHPYNNSAPCGVSLNHLAVALIPPLCRWCHRQRRNHSFPPQLHVLCPQTSSGTVAFSVSRSIPRYAHPRQVYARAVREGLRERGVVNRLSWADIEVAEPG